MAIAGRKALLKLSGTAVAFSSQATASGDNQRYTLSSTSLQGLPWSSTGTVSVTAGGSATTETYTTNRLTGSISFSSASTGRGAVLITGEYLPVTTVAEAKEFTISHSANNVADNAFGDTYVTRAQTLKDVTGSLSQWSTGGQTWYGIIASSSVANPVVLEFYTDSSTNYEERVWALISGQDLTAAVDGLVEEPIEWEGAADTDGRLIVFSSSE